MLLQKDSKYPSQKLAITSEKQHRIQMHGFVSKFYVVALAIAIYCFVSVEQLQNTPHLFVADFGAL